MKKYFILLLLVVLPSMAQADLIIDTYVPKLLITVDDKTPGADYVVHTAHVTDDKTIHEYWYCFEEGCQGLPGQAPKAKGWTYTLEQLSEALPNDVLENPELSKYMRQHTDLVLNAVDFTELWSQVDHQQGYKQIDYYIEIASSTNTATLRTDDQGAYVPEFNSGTLPPQDDADSAVNWWGTGLTGPEVWMMGMIGLGVVVVGGIVLITVVMMRRK